MSFVTIIDILLLVLLCMTLFYGIRLSRQFSEIRDNQDRLKILVDNLDTASSRAEKAVQSMRATAIETGENLQGQILKGQGLSEELEIMIEAADSLAERLQIIAEKSRKAVGGAGPTETKSKPATKVKAKSKSTSKKTAAKDEPRSRAEKELVEALIAEAKKQ